MIKIERKETQHLKAVWVGKQIMSEVRKEIRERFLSFLFTEI